MGAKTGEGRVFPLDARLRPDGETGVLVTPLSAYRDYFDHRAQFWEAQALTKARALCGPEVQPLKAAVTEIWRRWSAQPELKERINRMYRRIVKERAKGDEFPHFKTGKGGLIGIEFLIQYLQMKHQVEETNTLNALESLSNFLDPVESEILRKTYSFLRRIESLLRRVSNSAVSQLPPHAEELRHLAIRMGFTGRQDFLDEYTARRQQAEAIIWEHLG
jgi:glutamate-ammonia-ligase adenylyltransferase